MKEARIGALVLCLLLPLRRGAAQYVELTAEIETISWPSKNATGELIENLQSRSWTTRCVVGTNTWLIEPNFENRKETWWFTGSNITWHSVQTGFPSKHKELYERNHPEQMGNIGRRSTKVVESVHGYPGRPDLLWTPGRDDLWSPPNIRIPWLAFCSGSYLRRDGRQIPLPSIPFTRPFAYSDKTTVFEDDLGLPRSVELCTTNNQPVLQYRAPLTTNVLGWDFPLEFYLAQYRPAGTNGWELHLTAKGRVTAIGVGTQPRISTEVQKAIEK